MIKTFLTAAIICFSQAYYYEHEKEYEITTPVYREKKNDNSDIKIRY
jgi:hypothetical protein